MTATIQPDQTTDRPVRVTMTGTARQVGRNVLRFQPSSGGASIMLDTARSADIEVEWLQEPWEWTTGDVVQYAPLIAPRKLYTLVRGDDGTWGGAHLPPDGSQNWREDMVTELVCGRVRVQTLRVLHYEADPSREGERS